MVEDYIKQYLNQCNIMQLATSSNNVPWVVTVHFYADDSFNLYWISRPDRRHSKEIVKNPNVSSTVLIHENTESEDWVIGMTASGKAEIVENIEESIGQAYIDKFQKDPDLVAKINNGTYYDKWYVLRPTQISWFDNKNFPNDPRQTWEPMAN